MICFGLCGALGACRDLQKHGTCKEPATGLAGACKGCKSTAKAKAESCGQDPGGSYQSCEPHATALAEEAAIVDSTSECN